MREVPVSEMSQRPRLLLVSAVLPNRQGIGSEKRAWAHLVGMADCAEVTLALIGYEWADLDPVRQLGVEVVMLPAFPAEPVYRGPLRQHVGVLADVYSYAVLRRFSSFIRHRPDQVKQIARLLSKPQDIVVSFKLPAAASFDHWRSHLGWQPRHRIVDLDDVVSSFFRQRSRHAGSPLEWLFLQVLSRSRRHSEDRVLRQWDRVLLCGEGDASQMRDRNPAYSERVHILSNVFDTTGITPQPGAELASMLAEAAQRVPFRLLFVGLLNYHPNTDAVMFLADQVRPVLGQATRDVVITVAGRSAPETVRAACARAGFRLVENAPDLTPLYREAHAIIAPIRFGSGSRLKILEAWCHGKPLIATTMAMEGMDRATDAHFYRADTAAEMVQAVNRIIAAPQDAVGKATAGRALVDAAYGYDASRTAWRSLVEGAFKQGGS
jgi:hypothetical protein